MQRPDTIEPRPREMQRTNILESARRVFAHKGKAATMADVAQAAGVSQGLAYRYFASKEQIYRELVAHALEQAALATALPMDSFTTPGQRLALLITRMLDYRRDHLEVFQLLDQALRSDTVLDDVTELIRQHRERFLAELRQLIVAGQAAGEVAAGNPDHLVITIAATLQGLTSFGLHNPEQFQRLCPDASILLRMLKP